LKGGVKMFEDFELFGFVLLMIMTVIRNLRTFHLTHKMLLVNARTAHGIPFYVIIGDF
jgi:hypothetical protein